MYDDILVPTDGSDGTEQTLDHAIEIADNHDARLHALSVIDRRVYLAAEDEERDDVMATLRGQAEDAIERVEERLDDAGVEFTTAIADGTPHKEILSYAEENDADLIAIGTHGRTGRDRLENLGSVTERVVEDAERTVLVVSIGE
ncbi:Nucleotide-binding universal stress protein, UspA family [Natronoarchaeum philippinense]|uniref:Nucleotide-binding universal stress protein, UspA family n=1 Tax=Natronoarchaeum philippinense TaxID=558529 RepID=A0A285PA31_NATPI|nr:universal stress protein [Natronoarchaeum philippinense]SNZ18107.1 Nucleotide-binding universal stress protein, UspA family [Natronoarchaeum philippinense]